MAFIISKVAEKTDSSKNTPNHGLFHVVVYTWEQCGRVFKSPLRRKRYEWLAILDKNRCMFLTQRSNRAKTYVICGNI